MHIKYYEPELTTTLHTNSPVKFHFYAPSASPKYEMFASTSTYDHMWPKQDGSQDLQFKGENVHLYMWPGAEQGMGDSVIFS